MAWDQQCESDDDLSVRLPLSALRSITELEQVRSALFEV